MKRSSKAATKPLRVWVVGSHSVGKSSLVHHIADTYSLPVLDEIARIEMAKMGGGFDKLRTDLDAVTRFQRNVFAAQTRIGAGFKRYVSDRAVDNLAYAAESAATGTVSALWSSKECQRYVDLIRSTVVAKQGAVFFVRPGVKPVADGVRAEGDLDFAAIHRIDFGVKLLLELADIRYVPINTTIFQERASIVDGVLRHIV